MNNIIVLDSYDYAEALKKANVPEEQIKVEVARDRERTKAINEIIDNNLATKKELEIGLRETKKDIIIWLGGIVIIASGTVIAVIGHLISLLKL